VDNVAPHPDLGRSAELLGDWEGEGRGQWGGGDVFGYREWLRFAHEGKPLMSYAQRTAATDDGRPLHAESGYWRATGDAHVELVVAHAIGVAEIEVGRWDGSTLRLRTQSLRLSPSAKPVTALERDFELDGDTLRYTLRMSTSGAAPQWHLTAELRRVGSWGRP
jgi:hypothetical protein